MTKVLIINIVPCFGVNDNGSTWKNTAIVYVEKRKNGSFAVLIKG